MLIPNLRLRIASIDAVITLKTENGQTISVPKDLLPDVIVGAEVYLAVDKKPLVSAEQSAKDILNEIVGRKNKES